MSGIPQDNDDLYGDAPYAQIIISCRRNGNMSVVGTIDNMPYALAMLDNARDAIKSMHRKRAGNGSSLIVPNYDTSL